MYRASVAALAAFAALAVLVAHGTFSRIDQWAVDHLMPGAAFSGKPTLADAVVPLLGAHWHPALHGVSEIVTLPASFTPALAIVAVACAALRGRTGVALAAAFVAGNLIEVVVKASLTRPPLYQGSVRLAGFASSYPSGHTIRTILVALAVALAWPRLTWWALMWAAASIAMLLLGGQHVPSDIAGGLLVGGALAATTWTSRRRAGTSRRPSPACRPSSRER